MAFPLTPTIRDAMQEALIEEISLRGTFAEGSAGYLATLYETPDGVDLKQHELRDVLDMWPSLAPGWEE